MNPPTSASSPSLFSPVRIGAIDCPNRIFMAPLTRCHALRDGDVPQPINVTYYTQRASAGLIISEATQVSQQGKGYVDTPGMYSPAQQAGWRAITDAVHAVGGRIIAQLWHVGAISHPEFQPGGALPVSASAVNPGGVVRTLSGKQDRVAPRALETHEVAAVIEDWRHAAQVAQRAGFDGVEIHSANGYLIEQFIRDATNHRTDIYGGSIENRLRLCLSVVDACVSVFGRDRVGIRLSPVTGSNNCPQDSHPQATYGTLVDALDARGIAFIEFVEGQTGTSRNLEGFDFALARRRMRASYIANNRYTRDMALQAISTGAADAVSFGVPFISNPDLPERLRVDAPLAAANPQTFYTNSSLGYTDYPTLAQS